MDSKAKALFEKHIAVLESGDHNAQTAAACIRMYVAELEQKNEIREWCQSCANRQSPRCGACLMTPENPPRYYRRDA